MDEMRKKDMKNSHFNFNPILKHLNNFHDILGHTQFRRFEIFSDNCYLTLK
jgi:hypothetical protein